MVFKATPYGCGSLLYCPRNPPIADGTITNISSNGWGAGNVAAVVKHKLAGGGEFLAVYGHIVTSKNVGDPVTGGVPFAQIGAWPDGDHLHFGIHPSLLIPATNWGKMPNSFWPDTNEFVDHITPRICG